MATVMHAQVPVPMDDDKENTAQNHRVDLRAAKLRSVLADFDLRVEMNCTKMKEELSELVADLRSQLEIEIMKLPEGVREMPMKEFMSKYGGDVNQLFDENLKRMLAQLNVNNTTTNHTSTTNGLNTKLVAP
eukprot:TRINITY_DN15915_c0_g1_i1.p1 TRINITY_DN15915_c0_g1~~TRINITY_DN15915_c0_g1_i1.p1  ORF type:complete len:142 (+),score=44.19 TRINITY_DN15915_c0_g1_i1:32-427(+)